MSVKAICTRNCYTAKRWWEPGDIRIFQRKEDIEPCFAYSEDVKEVKEGPPAKPFSQLTVEEYVKLAKENEIAIPAEITKRDEIKNFLIEKGIDKK